MVFTNLWLCMKNSIIWILGGKEIASILSNFFPMHRNQTLCISRPVKIANKGWVCMNFCSCLVLALKNKVNEKPLVTLISYIVQM